MQRDIKILNEAFRLFNQLSISGIGFQMIAIPTISDRCFRVFSHGNYLNSANCVFSLVFGLFKK